MKNVKPIWERPTPGDPEFQEEFVKAKEICRNIKPGTRLRYIGKSTFKFSNWHPINHGDIVTVLGHVPAKVALRVTLSDGEPIGLNLYNLAYLEMEENNNV